MSLPSTPLSIKPSATEVKDGILTQKNLEIAIRALERDGLVVVEDLVQHSTLDKMNKKMVEDAYDLQSRKDSPFNYHKGNIQQDPPLTKAFFTEEVFTSTATPSSAWPAQFVNQPRSNCHANHQYSARSKAVLAFCVGKHRIAPY